MLKFRVTKKAYDSLSDDMKEHYEEAEDGKGYTLDVDGLPAPEDTGELKRAKDREKARADNLQEEINEANETIKKLESSQTKEDRDVARVTARLEKKIETLTAEKDGIINGLRGKIKTEAMNAAATKLANSLSSSPDLMVDHILKRLDVEFDADDVPTVKVLKDGKASDMTMDKLGEELKADKKFAPILTGSRARGGGADLTGAPVSPLGSSASTDQPPNLAKAPPSALVEHIKAVRQNANQTA